MILTATVLEDLAAVRLEVTGAASSTVTLERVDRNGTASVRRFEGDVAIGGSLIVTDYEPALGDTVTYHAGDGSTTVDATVTTPSSSVAVLTAAVRPTRRGTAAGITSAEQSAGSSSLLLEPLGREGDPIPVLRPLRRPRGSWQLLARTYAEAEALRDVAADGDLVLLRQLDHPGMDTFALVERVAVRSEVDPVRWTVTVDYVETAAPTDPLVAAAGWNLDALDLAYADLSEVQTAFATLRDLEVGP